MQASSPYYTGYTCWSVYLVMHKLQVEASSFYDRRIQGIRAASLRLELTWAAMGPWTMPGTSLVAAMGGTACSAGNAAGAETCPTGRAMGAILGVGLGSMTAEVLAGTSRVGSAAGAGAVAACPVGSAACPAAGTWAACCAAATVPSSCAQQQPHKFVASLCISFSLVGAISKKIYKLVVNMSGGCPTYAQRAYGQTETPQGTP